MPDVIKPAKSQSPLVTTYDNPYEHSVERYFDVMKMVEEADQELVVSTPKFLAKSAGK